MLKVLDKFSRLSGLKPYKSKRKTDGINALKVLRVVF